MLNVNPSEVQGHILRGFNKSTVRVIFFRFGNDKIATKKWLTDISRKISSTTELIEASKELQARRKDDPSYDPQEIWLHVSLSRTGVEKLGLTIPPSRDIYTGRGKETKLVEREELSVRNDPFMQGMKQREQLLVDNIDPRFENWIEPFRTMKIDSHPADPVKLKKGTEIDALFIIASDNEDDGDSYTLRLIQEATLKGILCIGLQLGKALENEQGKQVEHFGFRDGISQPLIEGIDEEEITKLTTNKVKFCPEDFVVSGLSGDLEWANNGSFLVYRRLRQDVAGFWEFMNKNCRELCSTPEDLAAMFVGRWKSGAPIAKHRSDPVAPKDSDFNDFVYSNDPTGVNTPKFAHTRIINPRDDNLNDSTHMILRRGLPYGVSWAKDQDPAADRGLLFMCFQRDLHAQFEHLQKLIYSKTNYPEPDPQNPGPHDELINLVLKRGFRLYMEQWVTCTGGEYFFSPSISALENLFFERFQPDSKPYQGLTYAEWTKKWWLWLLAIPRSTNPACDTTGNYSTQNQPDSDVWFLAGSLGGAAKRECTIPPGRAILVPIINDEQSLAEKPEFKDQSELVDIVKKETDTVTTMNAVIDNIHIPGLKKYRLKTGPFDVTLPKDNIWGVKAGPTRAAADGYWLFLKPLLPGKHTIHLYGKGAHFETEVIYYLNVEDISH